MTDKRTLATADLDQSIGFALIEHQAAEIERLRADCERLDRELYTANEAVRCMLAQWQKLEALTAGK